MRIVFFGSSDFSVPSLRAVAGQTVCVVTRRAKPKGRGYSLDDNEVKLAASDLSIPVVEIDSFKDEAVRILPDYAPDLFVVASFGLIVPQWVLDIPVLGPLNIHPSLLPLYRGPSPMQWAILNGNNMTGITFIRMNERMDAGDIVYREEAIIEEGEDFLSLSDRLSKRAADVLPGIVDTIGLQGVMAGVTQNEEQTSYTPIITKEMGKIDWTKDARSIACQVRAFVRWPTAYSSLDGKMVKVFEVRWEEGEGSQGAAGRISEVTKEGIFVETGHGTIRMKDLQMENKRRMTAHDFAQGYRGLVGKVLS